MTPRMWGRGTCTHVDTICTWTHHLLTVVEVQVVLRAVPGLVLDGEVAVKRRSLVVLYFGLDVSCPIADS